MSSSEYVLSTKEVADEIGVPVTRVQGWVRDGRLAPHTEGEGRQKRHMWSKRDLEAARELKDRNGQAKLVAEMAVFLGPEFMRHIPRAQMMLASTSDGEAVAAGPLGVRIVRSSDPCSEVFKRAGSPALLLSPDFD